METPQYKTFRLNLAEQSKLLAKAIYQEVFDSIYGGYTFADKLREVLPNYRYDVEKEMRARAATLPCAKYTFEDKYCQFSKGEKVDLLLELPTKKEAEWNHGFDRFFGAKITPSLKYITATSDQGKKVVAAIYGFGMHRDMVAEVERITGNKLSNISGGRFKVNKSMFGKPTLEIYGSSQDFGRADHSEVAQILNNNGLEAKVVD